MPNPVLLSDLRVFLLYIFGWSMVVTVCWIGPIACPFSNIPHISAPAAEATTYLSDWQMVRM